MVKAVLGNGMHVDKYYFDCFSNMQRFVWQIYYIDIHFIFTPI